MKVIVAYDISDDGDRAKFSAALSTVGERLQRSVFQCDLTEQQLAQILRHANNLIDHTNDAVHVFPQCPTCTQEVRTVGVAHVPKAVEYWIIT
jgi:CRISPR-associated protein Cas2